MPRLPRIRIRRRRTRAGLYVYLDYYDGRHRVRESVGPDSPEMRRLARQVADRRLLELARARIRDAPPARDATFAELARVYLDRHAAKLRSRESVASSVRGLVAAFGSVRLAHLTAGLVEQWQADRLAAVSPCTHRPYRPGSINRDLRVLRGMLSRAVAWGYLEASPLRGVRPLRDTSRRTRVLSPAEFEQLVGACSATIRPMVILAWYTGMRRGEILGLRWHQVDLAAAVILLSDTKSGRERLVPLSREALAVLRAQPRRLGTDLVFPNSAGGPYRGAQYAFRRAVRKAGLEIEGPQRVTWHTLRHSFATHLGASPSVDVATLRELLGHASLGVTTRYAHSSLVRKAEAVRVMEDLGAKELARKPIPG